MHTYIQTYEHHTYMHSCESLMWICVYSCVYVSRHQLMSLLALSLQCVSVCCSMLQFVAVYRSELQGVAVYIT